MNKKGTKVLHIKPWEKVKVGVGVAYHNIQPVIFVSVGIETDHKIYLLQHCHYMGLFPPNVSTWYPYVTLMWIVSSGKLEKNQGVTLISCQPVSLLALRWILLPIKYLKPVEGTLLFFFSMPPWRSQEEAKTWSLITWRSAEHVSHRATMAPSRSGLGALQHLQMWELQAWGAPIVRLC